tara:strand:+ start:3260 stop:5053 length:1794 start_codon:yes stop_codon:yes gene_type:complete
MKNDKNLKLKKINEYLFKNLKAFSLGFAMVFIVAQIGTGLNIYALTFLQELLDEGLGQANPEKIEELIPVIVKLWIIQGFVTYFAKYMAAWFGGSISKKLRIVIFEKLLKIPDYWFQKKGRHGDMLTRMSADINKISDFFTYTISELLIVPMKIMLSSIVLFIVAPRLTITLLVTVPILAKIFKIGISKIQHYTQETQFKLSQLTEITRETIEGIKLVHLFRIQEDLKNKFSTKANELFKVHLKNFASRIWLVPTMHLANGIIFGTILWLAAWEMKNGNSQFLNINIDPKYSMFDVASIGGITVYFSILVSGVLGPSKILGPLLARLAEAQISAGRLMDIENLEEVKDEGTTEIKKETCSGEISIKSLNFKYDQSEKGVKDINLSISPRQKVCITGPSGSGKSTLFSLLMRLRESDQGEIKIDGQNIQDIKIDSLRSIIGYVPQEPYLFSTTIKENISIGSEKFSEDEIIIASKNANAHEFIMECEKGYETIVGTAGSTLSGGQRQRIALARAYLLNTPILLLDEPSSHLDVENIERIEKVIKKLSENKTVIEITHNTKKIMHSDYVILMKDGEVVDSGKPKDLLKKNTTFSKMINK